VSAFALSIVLASALLHATWNTATKRSDEPLAFLLWIGLASSALFVLLFPFFDYRELPAEIWPWVAGTGLVHGLYRYWLGMAYQRGDLTVVYSIARSTPVFLPILALPVLGETISVPGALGIGLVVAGIWLIQGGGAIRLRRLVAPGIVYAYLTLATTVGYSLLDKRVMEILSAAPWSGPLPRSVVFYFILTVASSVVFLPLVAARLGVRELARSARGAGWIGAGLVAQLASYGLILEAMRTAKVSYVVAVRQTSVLFALAIAVLWLGERPGPWRALGVAGTVAGVALISLWA
jgi:drug/metabolite transporter (DMT)-like permease